MGNNYRTAVEQKFVNRLQGFLRDEDDAMVRYDEGRMNLSRSGSRKTDSNLKEFSANWRNAFYRVGDRGENVASFDVSTSVFLTGSFVGAISVFIFNKVYDSYKNWAESKKLYAFFASEFLEISKLGSSEDKSQIPLIVNKSAAFWRSMAKEMIKLFPVKYTNKVAFLYAELETMVNSQSFNPDSVFFTNLLDNVKKSSEEFSEKAGIDIEKIDN